MDFSIGILDIPEMITYNLQNLRLSENVYKLCLAYTIFGNFPTVF